MQWAAIPTATKIPSSMPKGGYGRCPATFMQYCPSLYCHGFLAAFGGTGIADNYSGCSEYANDLPVIVDEDGNYYGRFSVANSLGIQIPMFEDTSPSPSYCAPDLKVSGNTVYLTGTGSVVILPSIPSNSGR